MNLFSRFKAASGADDDAIEQIIAACKRHAAGEADVLLDTAIAGGRLAELAGTLNEIFAAANTHGTDDRIGATLDHVRRVRLAMEKLFHEPQLCSAMGESARRRFETLFTADRMGEQYYALYRELTEQTGTKALQ